MTFKLNYIFYILRRFFYTPKQYYTLSILCLHVLNILNSDLSLSYEAMVSLAEKQ